MTENTAAVPVVSLTSNNQLTTTSQNVAEVFGKQHKDVIRSIENLKGSCPVKFNERNFAPVEYADAKGEMRPMYLLTRDGLTLLVMGYTGKEAMKFKIAYIEAFNAMEAKLKAEEQAKALPKPAPSLSKAVPAPEPDEITRDICFQVRQRLLKKSLPERIAVWKRVQAALEGEAASVPSGPSVPGGRELLPDKIKFPAGCSGEVKVVWENLVKAQRALDMAFQSQEFAGGGGTRSVVLSPEKEAIYQYCEKLHIAAMSNINAAGAFVRGLLALKHTVDFC